jgi:antitoxin MazE
MRIKLVSIGNSKGIRLPRAVIEQAGLTDEIELEVKKGQLVIRSAKKPREGWDEGFKKAGAPGNDELLDEADAHTESEWDRTEWTW